MRGRAKDSTNPPTPPAVPLPEPNGPTDDRFVYHLTPKAQRLLEQHQADGTKAPLFHRAAKVANLGEALTRENRRQERSRLARDARRRGRRFGTISRRHQGGEARPFLRLSGKWLGDAGFDLGQYFEIEVEDGRLTIEAV